MTAYIKILPAYRRAARCGTMVRGMPAPTRIKMPDKNGKPIPNPIRWGCDVGHVHPSRHAAVRCNIKNRERLAGRTA